MNLLNDYAPRMHGSIPYNLRNENGGIGKLLATIIIGLLAMVVRTSGVLWRLCASLVMYSTSASKSVSKSTFKAVFESFSKIIRNIVVPFIFVLIGYYFFKDWTLVGVRNLAIVIMMMAVLFLAFRGSRKEKGDQK